MLPFLLLLSFAFADKPRPAQEEDIRESVFRYLFTHNQSALQQKAKSLHLCLGEKDADPTPAFLKRFAAHRPPVRACSSFDTAAKTSLSFHIRQISWTTNTHAEVNAGYFESNLSAADSVLLLVREAGKWKVTGVALQTVARR